jgi:transcriptional regulator with XRE-family HTH domain
MEEMTVNPTVLKTVRASTGLTQREFSALFGIPVRTFQNWENGTRKCADYIYRMMVRILAPMQTNGVDIRRAAWGYGILYGLLDPEDSPYKE